jgi:hypothetical protein
MTKDAFAVLCLAACFFALPPTADACGCAGGAPLSLHVNGTPVIFAGTVESVTGGMPRPIVATFSVVKTYRGALKERAVVSGDGTDCDRNFVKGETYLVYATEHAGVLLTHECTRTRALAEAAEDLRYLDNLAAGRAQVLIYGNVFRGMRKPDGSLARYALSERLEVVATSNRGRQSVTTDQWGPYQIVLAPGDYEIWVERRGRRVTRREKFSLRGREERRLSFTVEDR